MSKLTIQSHVMPAAPLPAENPLSPLRAYETASAAGASIEQGGWADAGNEASILPYRLQDQYDRQRTPRSFKTAVLENQFLRATFVLDLGGRLWSLIHKPTNRELLFANPVFQPGNLAVRDAWFCGGVEWNISIIGHSPLTCAPLFAARVEGDDGTPVLRMYEWDRVRRVPFQIDCWLPKDAPFLLVRVRITNPNDLTVPMYWWSNIGVDEREDVRVIAPAVDAYRHDYDGSLVEHQVPIYNGADVTYTTNRRSAADLYFRIPDGHRPWIAALDREGRGLVHTSTDRLRGRKMFNWGMDAGGRRWQEFLSEPGQAYIEIQGGLAQTQGEYLAMPAGAKWEWLEAYGLLEANAREVHGNDWAAAHQAAERQLERSLPRSWMDDMFAQTSSMADRAPTEILHYGSGWVALENRRRSRAQQSPFASAAIPFPDDSMGDEQQQWLALLERGELPKRAPTDTPGSLMVQPEWRNILERRSGANWLSWYHLGVMRFRAGDRRGAREAWEKSRQLENNAWATRDLAVLSRDEGDDCAAADLWVAASQIAPNVAPLSIECAAALLRVGRHDDLVAFIESRTPAVRTQGRIRLLRAMAALALGDLATVEQYFTGEPDIANIREKETSLSDLWFGWHEQRLSRERNVPIDDHLRRLVRHEFPPPEKFDFRLNAALDVKSK